MLTHTSNKHEIQWIQFLTASFVPFHYQSSIKTKEVTQNQCISLRRVVCLQLHEEFGRSMKTYSVLKICYRLHPSCVWNPLAFLLCCWILITPFHFAILAVNPIWWCRDIKPLTLFQRGVNHVIHLWSPFNTCSTWFYICIIHGRILVLGEIKLVSTFVVTSWIGPEDFRPSVISGPLWFKCLSWLAKHRTGFPSTVTANATQGTGAQTQRNKQDQNLNNKRRSLMRQNRVTTKQKVQKGQAEESGVRAGRQGRWRQDQRQKTGRRKKDNNPATDKGKSDTIYRRENRCTTWDGNEARVAEDRCREWNDQGDRRGRGQVKGMKR